MRIRAQAIKAIKFRKRVILIHYVCLLGVIVLCALAAAMKLWPDSLYTLFNSVMIGIAAVYLGIGIIYSLINRGKTIKDLFYTNYHRKIARKPARSLIVVSCALLFFIGATMIIGSTHTYSFKNHTGTMISLKINFAGYSSEKREAISEVFFEKRCIVAPKDVFYNCGSFLSEDDKIMVLPGGVDGREYEILSCQEQ
jgi:hypothetical protein